MGLFSSKPKITFFIKLSYTKETRAEVTKNYFKDRKMLNKILSEQKSYFKSDDFNFINYENDSDKVFKIYLSAAVKDSPKVTARLEKDLQAIFDCNDIEVANSLDGLTNVAVTTTVTTTPSKPVEATKVVVATPKKDLTTNAASKDTIDDVIKQNTQETSNESESEPVKDKNFYTKSPYEVDGE